jgi:hypothetical protein
VPQEIRKYLGIGRRAVRKGIVSKNKSNEIFDKLEALFLREKDMQSHMRTRSSPPTGSIAGRN